MVLAKVEGLATYKDRDHGYIWVNWGQLPGILFKEKFKGKHT